MHSCPDTDIDPNSSSVNNGNHGRNDIGYLILIDPSPKWRPKIQIR